MLSNYLWQEQKKGFYLGAEVVMPALILAYVLVQFLTITGLMTVIGTIVSPIIDAFFSMWIVKAIVVCMGIE